MMLVLTWFIFFSRVLIGSQAYWLDDLKAIYYPLEVVYAQSQQALQLPVWSNYFGFGQPLIAWGQLGFFTPVHVVLRALQIAPFDVLQISIVTYFALGLLGMFVFLRHWRLPQLPAALGAIIFVFSGFNIGHLNHVNFYTATMILPWLLYNIQIFLERPTIRRAVVMSLLVATMALSAQPQIVLYNLLLAAIIGSVSFIGQSFNRGKSALRQNKTLTTVVHWILNGYNFRVLSLVLLAALIALATASFAVLPLYEFLPFTERSDVLPESELFDFSYPPSHAITLVLPYFFGDHDNYWGAKGFQELAAFVGVLPLFLAGAALASWRIRRPLRIAALFLVVIGILFALGVNSPIYRYLVAEKIITSVANPGRFVFFFNVGIALLASLGLSDLFSDKRKSRWHLLRIFLTGLALPALLFLPFFLSKTDARIAIQWLRIIQSIDLSWLLAIVGALVIPFLIIFISFRLYRLGEVVVLLVTAVTLLHLGWNYNPLTPRPVQLDSPFLSLLRQANQESELPPRLYSRPELLTDIPRLEFARSPFIAPDLSIYQPVEIKTNPACFTIPAETDSTKSEAITVGLHKAISEPAIDSHNITASDILVDQKLSLCFDSGEPIDDDGQYVLSFTSSQKTAISLALTKIPGQLSAYIVRVDQPSPVELVRSQKELRVTVLPTQEKTDIDADVILLERHLQATAEASSARWISALAIRTYRDFIETFFANDREPYDGDSKHVLESRRQLFNIAGVTHLAQVISPGIEDLMPDAGFVPIGEYASDQRIFRFYKNPAAYPKAFLQRDFKFKPAPDHVLAALQDDQFDPSQIALIGGTRLPDVVERLEGKPAQGTARITFYSNTQVDVDVETDDVAWLIVTDATTPQWVTYIDDQPAPYFTDLSIFKAALVPSGKHVVSFRYESSAITQAKFLTVSALIICLLLVLPWRWLYRKIIISS